MLDPDTFLTALFVQVDDFFQAQLPASCAARIGRPASLSQSEVITLGIFGQWFGFGSERGFWRWGGQRLRGAFPTLPSRPQFNRLLRAAQADLTHFAVALAESLGASRAPCQALDSTAAPTRSAKRRGAGWLWGQADLGHSNRLGFYEGFRVLATATAQGVVTGFGFAPASTNDLPLAEAFLSARHGGGHPRLPGAGAPAQGLYAADKAFASTSRRERWRDLLGVRLWCVPPRPRGQAQHPWPKALRRWIAGKRQIIETAFQKLHECFGLQRERPHALAGFAARLAARVGLHNFCILLNRQSHRPCLAFADLVDW